MADEGALLAVIEVAQQRLEGLGGLLGLVEGDSPVSRVSMYSRRTEKGEVGGTG
jgi:hypothetical protein